MSWHMLIWRWLAEAALLALLLSAAGTLAVCLCRQPVKRLQIIQLTLTACLLALVLRELPVWPRWSLGWMDAHRTIASADRSVVAGGEGESLPPPPGMHELVVDDRPAPAAPVERSAVGIHDRSPERETRPVGEAPASRIRAPSAAALIPQLAVALYWISVAVLVGRWSAGLMRLTRVRRTTEPVPAWVSGVLRQIAGPAAERVQVLATSMIEVPITCGWRRPVILLPRRLLEVREENALRYCLAHEWSHIERRDLRAWHLATLAQLVFFYQPLLWWLRRQLRLCQDYLADARAVEQSSTAADYAEFLVHLARSRLQPAPAPALSFFDRRSHLYRRISMLLKNQQPLERRCRRGWSVAAACLAATLVGAVSLVRLAAEDNARAPADSKQPEPETQASDPAEDGRSYTYTCRVTDKITGEGLDGAVVTVRRSLLGDPRYREAKVIEETQHTTDAGGRYTVTIPPEQAQERYLYIELDVYHAEHAPRTGFGYAFSMIRKNERLGERPFFEHVELYPGKAITGTIQTPDGEPAAGVKVLSFSKHAHQGGIDRGAFAHAETDENGRFRLVIATPGEGVFWIHPREYVSTVHPVPDERGDTGTHVLRDGIRLSGQVLDARGNPVPSAWVNAGRAGDPNDEITQLLNSLSVGDSIDRSGLSDEHGHFKMAPLPPGEYRIEVGEYSSEPSQRDRRRFPVEPVFMAFKLTLREGEELQPLEVRAVPHVEIHVQHLDSRGQPSRGHEVMLFGRMDGEFFHTSSGRPADGRIVIRAPHGLENAQLNAMTNEHGVMRHRLSKDGPLRNGRRIELGTLNADVRGIEVVRYTAPILLVKAVDKGGQPIDDYQIMAEYASRGEDTSRFVLEGGRRSDVRFERQQDGRFRSKGLLPDEDVNVTLHADGYTSSPQEISLAEGTEEELVFVLGKE